MLVAVTTSTRVVVSSNALDVTADSYHGLPLVAIYEHRGQLSSSITPSRIARLSKCIIPQYLNLASKIPRILAIYSVHVPLGLHTVPS